MKDAGHSMFEISRKVRQESHEASRQTFRSFLLVHRGMGAPQGAPLARGGVAGRGTCASPQVCRNPAISGPRRCQSSSRSRTRSASTPNSARTASSSRPWSCHAVSTCAKTLNLTINPAPGYCALSGEHAGLRAGRLRLPALLAPMPSSPARAQYGLPGRRVLTEPSMPRGTIT